MMIPFKKVFWLYLLTAICIGLNPGAGLAQEKESEMLRLPTVWVQGEVIGILEDYHTLGVVQIRAADSARSFGLAKGEEILVEFKFGTRATSGDPQLPGLRAGDIIRAEITGKKNPSSGQWEYRIFRYSVLKP